MWSEKLNLDQFHAECVQSEREYQGRHQQWFQSSPLDCFDTCINMLITIRKSTNHQVNVNSSHHYSLAQQRPSPTLNQL
jgi:hypothetical protein